MKKLKIRNPWLRWFAALVTIIVTIIVGAAAIVGGLYGLGQLGEPLFWKFQPQLVTALIISEEVEAFTFEVSLAWGSMVLVGLLVIAVCMIILYGLGKGVEWTGNRLYNNVVIKVKTA